MPTNINDETENRLEEDVATAGSIASRFGGNALKKKAAQGLKNAGKALFKKVAALIGKFIADFVAFAGVAVLVALAVSVVLTFLYNLLYGKLNPSFCNDENDRAIEALYYQKYSDQSVYVIIDEPTEMDGVTYSAVAPAETIPFNKLLQTGTTEWDNLKISDLDGYLDGLKLNYKVLLELNNKLNDGYLYPAGFTKPVFTEPKLTDYLSTDKIEYNDLKLRTDIENSYSKYYYEESDNSYVKNTLSSDELAKYKALNTEALTEEENEKLRNEMVEKNVFNTNDIGMGSVAHLQGYIQPSRVANYKINNAEVLNNWTYGESGANAIKVVSGDELNNAYSSYGYDSLNLFPNGHTNLDGTFNTGLYKVEDTIEYGNYTSLLSQGYSSSNRDLWGKGDLVESGIPAPSLVWAVDKALTMYGPLKFGVTYAFVNLGDAYHTQTYTLQREFNTNIGVDGVVSSVENAENYKALYVDGTLIGLMAPDAKPSIRTEQERVIYNPILPVTGAGYHIVIFNTNGGTLKQTAYVVQDGNKVPDPGTPVKDGYNFDGWYTSGSFTRLFNFNTAITGNTTVYAKWTANGDEGGGGGYVEPDPVYRNVDYYTFTLKYRWNGSQFVKVNDEKTSEYKAEDHNFVCKPYYIVECQATAMGTLQTRTVMHRDLQLASDASALEYLDNYIANYKVYVPTHSYEFDYYEDIHDVNENGEIITPSAPGNVVIETKDEITDIPENRFVFMAEATGEDSDGNKKTINYKPWITPRGLSLDDMPQSQKNYILNEMGISTFMTDKDVVFDSYDIIELLGLGNDEIPTEDLTLIEKASEETGVDATLIKMFYLYAESIGADNKMNLPAGKYEYQNILDSLRAGSVQKETINFNGFNDGGVIKAAAGYLQSLLLKYDGNVPLVIMEYGYGEETLNEMLKLYSEYSYKDIEIIKNDPYRIGWVHIAGEFEDTTKYPLSDYEKKITSPRQKEYFGRILYFLTKNSLVEKYLDNNVLKTRSWSVYTLNDDVIDADADLSEKLMLRAYYNLKDDKSKMNDLFKYITCNQEDIGKGSLKYSKDAELFVTDEPIEYKIIESGRSDTDSSAIRNSVLLRSTGASWEDVDGTSNQKISALFSQTLGNAKKFSSIINATEIFGNSRIGPALESYTLSRYNYNVKNPVEIDIPVGTYDPSAEILISTSAETQEVKAISKGMINNIVPNEDGTYYVSVIVMNGKNDDLVYSMMNIAMPEEQPEEPIDEVTPPDPDTLEETVDEEMDQLISAREDADNQDVSEEEIQNSEGELESRYEIVTIEYGHLKNFPEELKVGDVIESRKVIGEVDLNEWITVKISADNEIIKIKDIITAAYASFGDFAEPNLMCDAYQDRQYNRSVPNFVGECTWFVWGRLYELYGVNWSYLQGNGGYVAERLGNYADEWEFCDFPVAGGVISSAGPTPGVGHVMFVKKFDPDTNELIWQDSWQALWQASTFKGGTGPGWKENRCILAGGPGAYSFTGSYASYGSITCVRLKNPEAYKDVIPQY